jgi:Tfp pilus assembly protein FimT
MFKKQKRFNLFFFLVIKKSFTALELIFVIIIIGIISFISSPRINNTSLYQCADQVLSHIRYTQHLAMINNKFKPIPLNNSIKEKKSVKYWFKGWWQIRFQKHHILNI